VLHGIEHIFPRHTALLLKQYGFESPVLGVCKQATKLGSVGRLGACQSMVFVPRGDSVSVAFGHLLPIGVPAVRVRFVRTCLWFPCLVFENAVG